MHGRFKMCASNHAVHGPVYLDDFLFSLSPGPNDNVPLMKLLCTEIVALFSM